MPAPLVDPNWRRLRDYRNGYKSRAKAAEARRREEVREARALGVKVVRKRVAVDPSWDGREDAVLRALYPDHAAIRARLPHRSAHSIEKRITRLRIAPPVLRWSAEEDAALRRLWRRATPAELSAALPGKSYRQIDHRARRLGLPNRGKPPYALTGDPLCDELRERCRVLGYTMHYLDTIAGTGTYFQNGGWNGREGHRTLPMIRALRALGGTFTVAWPDDGECVDRIDVGGS